MDVGMSDMGGPGMDRASERRIGRIVDRTVGGWRAQATDDTDEITAWLATPLAQVTLGAVVLGVLLLAVWQAVVS